MKAYKDLLRRVVIYGNAVPDRTGTGTKRLVHNTVFCTDLRDGFPMLTLRKLDFDNIMAELLWFISGSTNTNDLPLETQKWWTPWADSKGDLGPIYGEQLRASKWWFKLEDGLVRANSTDQLSYVIDQLKTDPYSRRHVINLWHTPAMKMARLPCCHGSIIQFFVDGPLLHCKMYQRSADIILGVPVNIASYALLMTLIAHEVGLRPAGLDIYYGDLHIYDNHDPGLLLARDPMDYQMPELQLNPYVKHVVDFTAADIKLLNYKAHPPISFKIAV